MRSHQGLQLRPAPPALADDAAADAAAAETQEAQPDDVDSDLEHEETFGEENFGVENFDDSSTCLTRRTLKAGRPIVKRNEQRRI